MQKNTEKKIIIKVQSLDKKIVDEYVKSIVRIVQNGNGYIVGPTPLPIQDPKFIIHTAPNIEKNTRDKKLPRAKYQVLLYIFDESNNSEIINNITNLKIPSGMGIEIKSQEV